MPEQARPDVREQALQPEHAARGAAGGAAAGVGEHELGVGPASHQAEQRFELVRLDAGVATHQALVTLQLHRHGARQAQALDQQFFREFGEPILDRGVEVADGLEDGER